MPLVADGGPKSRQIHLRVSDEGLWRLRAIAAARGEDLSEVIRALIDDCYAREVINGRGPPTDE